MTPTAEQLAAVRQAAEQIFIEGLDAWYQQAIDVAEFALATIPPDPQAPITAEWLREIGCKEASDSEGTDYTIRDEHGTLRLKIYQCGDVWACEEPDWPDDLHCRLQVVQIMSALGIGPKGEGV